MAYSRCSAEDRELIVIIQQNGYLTTSMRRGSRSRRVQALYPIHNARR